MSTARARRVRKLVAAVCGCVAVGAVSGIVASAVFGSGDARTIRPAAVGAALAGGKKVEVARFPAVPGLADRSVFLEQSGGLVCLWDAVDASHEGGGACNREDDPFGGTQMLVSLGWDGGPQLATVRNARLSGIVSDAVDRVYLELSDGSTRSIKLARSAPYRAFAYRIRQADARAVAEPVAVVALDPSGRAIDRQPTGFR
jgi:hypothetical protein